MKWDSKFYIIGIAIFLVSGLFWTLGDVGSLGPFLVEFYVLVPAMAFVFAVAKPHSIYNLIILFFGIGVVGSAQRGGPEFFGLFFLLAVLMFGIIQVKNWLKGKKIIYRTLLVIGVFFMIQTLLLFVMPAIDVGNDFVRTLVFESIHYLDYLLAFLSVILLIKDSSKNLLNVGVKRFLMVYSLEIILSQVFQLVKILA